MQTTRAPLEPEATVTYWDFDDDEEPHLVVVGRSINIHHHLHMLQEALGWENMSYEEAFVGGQFGLKIDVVSEASAPPRQSSSARRCDTFPACTSPCS